MPTANVAADVSETRRERVPDVALSHDDLVTDDPEGVCRSPSTWKTPAFTPAAQHFRGGYRVLMRQRVGTSPLVIARCNKSVSHRRKGSREGCAGAFEP